MFNVSDESFVSFVTEECMKEVAAHSVFLHVCLPGQEHNADSLAPEFVFALLRLSFSLG